MLKEIILMRRQGMSFRKIAEKLNSTVGKVHYQWIKFAKVNPELPIDFQEAQSKKSNTPKTDVPKHYLITRLVHEQKLVSFWEIAVWQKELVVSFFNNKVNEKIIILRLYDVTDILFNGSNAHSFHEFQLTSDKTYWFIKGIKPGRSYLTEIGYKVNQNQYFPILRSNVVNSKQMLPTQDFPFSFEAIQKEQPIWAERVSTYSYYENIKEVKNEND